VSIHGQFPKLDVGRPPLLPPFGRGVCWETSTVVIPISALGVVS
jgi:hypothetical protein